MKQLCSKYAPQQVSTGIFFSCQTVTFYVTIWIQCIFFGLLSNTLLIYAFQLVLGKVFLHDLFATPKTINKHILWCSNVLGPVVSHWKCFSRVGPSSANGEGWNHQNSEPIWLHIYWSCFFFCGLKQMNQTTWVKQHCLNFFSTFIHT